MLQLIELRIIPSFEHFSNGNIFSKNLNLVFNIFIEREAARAEAEANRKAPEVKEKNLVKAKSKIEYEDILDKLKELSTKVKETGNIVELEDFKVSEYLRESVKWSTAIDKLERRKVELKKLVVLHPMDSTE